MQELLSHKLPDRSEQYVGWSNQCTGELHKHTGILKLGLYCLNLMITQIRLCTEIALHMLQVIHFFNQKREVFIHKMLSNINTLGMYRP